MFLSADRLIQLGVGAAQVRLVNLIRHGDLDEPAESAYEGGMALLLRVGPLGDLPGLSRLVRIQFTDPVYGDDTVTVGMRWETQGAAAALFPVLDADIKLTAEDGGARTRMVLTGCYRPPFGAVGAGLDRVLMRKVAMRTMTSLLTSLAATLAPETASDAIADSAASHEWDPALGPGPQLAED